MSALSKLVPLLLVFLLVGVLAFVGYAVYLTANDIADKTSKKMENKNVVFTKDGMKVGVKEKRTENYVDQTQNMLVKAWNFSSWPAYKSRYWNKEQQTEPQSSHSSSTGAKPN